MKLTQVVYFVSFIKLNNNNNTLIYSYIHYPIKFCLSIVVYFILINYYIKSLGFKDRGYYFIILYNSFLSMENIDHYIKTTNVNDNIGLNCLWLFINSYLTNHLKKISLYEAKY